MSRSRIARTYDVQGRRIRLPGLLERTPPGWTLISSTQRVNEMPSPLRVQSADDLTLIAGQMRTFFIAAVEIERQGHKRTSKYQPLFKEVLLLKAGGALKIEFDSDEEMRRVMNAVRQQFQSIGVDGFAVHCTINRALKTGYVERVPPPTKDTKKKSATAPRERRGLHLNDSEQGATRHA